MPLPLPDSTVMPPLIENSSAGGMKRTGEMKRSIDSRVNLPELELQIQKESHREQRDAVISIFRECVAAGDQAMADGATSEAGGACSGAAADGMLRATQQYKRAAEAFIRAKGLQVPPTPPGVRHSRTLEGADSIGGSPGTPRALTEQELRTRSDLANEKLRDAHVAFEAVQDRYEEWRVAQVARRQGSHFACCMRAAPAEQQRETLEWYDAEQAALELEQQRPSGQPRRIVIPNSPPPDELSLNAAEARP